MKMKKFLSFFLALVMILSSASVFAADYSLWHKTDASKNAELMDVLGDFDKFMDVATNITDYVIEYGGKYYNLKELNDYMDAHPDEGIDTVVTKLKAVPKPGSDLEVIEITAISKKMLVVNFSEAVSTDLKPENFEVSVGGTAKTVTNVVVSDTTATLTVDGLNFGDKVQAVVKDIKNLDGSKTLATATVETIIGSVKDLYEIVLESEEPSILANGASTTMITATLRNKKTKQIQDLEAELQFVTTKGQMAQQFVVLKKGKATVNLISESSPVDLLAFVTATIVSVPSDAAYEGLRSLELVVPFKVKAEDLISETLLSLRAAEARQADRIFLTLSDKITPDMEKRIRNFFKSNGNFGIEVDGNIDAIKDIQVKDEVLTLILDVDNKVPTNVVTPANKLVGALQDNIVHNVNIPAIVENTLLPLAKEMEFTFTDTDFPTFFNVHYIPQKKIIRAIFKEAVAEDHAEEAIPNLDGYNINRHFLINSKPLLITAGAKATKTELDYAKNNSFIVANAVYVSEDDKNQEGYIVEGPVDTRHIVTIQLDQQEPITKTTETYALQVSMVGDWAGLSDPKNVIQTQTLPFEITGDTSVFEAKVEVQSPEQFLIRFTQDVNTDKFVEEVFKISADKAGMNWLDYDTDFEVRVLDAPKQPNKNMPKKDYFDQGTKLAKGAPVHGGTDFLLELKKDWQVIYDTESSGNTYFNPVLSTPHQLKILAETVSGKVFSKQFEVETPHDADSPEVSYAEIQGSDVFIIMNEPVKAVSGALEPSEGRTVSQEQDKSAIHDVPPLAVEFVNESSTKSVIGTLNKIWEDDYAFVVTPVDKLDPGKWNVFVRSTSDDIGNTVKTTKYELEVPEDPAAPAAAPRVEWIAFDNIDKGNSNKDQHDRIYVKFTEEMYTGPEAYSTGRTENWSVNGQTIAKESRVEIGIKGITSKADGFTISMPGRQWDGVEDLNVDFAMIVTMASNFRSASGKKLVAPYKGVYEVPLDDTGKAGANVITDHDMDYEAFWYNDTIYKNVMKGVTIYDEDGDGVVDKLEIDGPDHTKMKSDYEVELANGLLFEIDALNSVPGTMVMTLKAGSPINYNTSLEVLKDVEFPDILIASKKHVDKAAPVLYMAKLADSPQEDPLVEFNKDSLEVHISEPVLMDDGTGTMVKIDNTAFHLVNDDTATLSGEYDFDGRDTMIPLTINNGELIDDVAVVATIRFKANKVVDLAEVPNKAVIKNVEIQDVKYTTGVNLINLAAFAQTPANAGTIHVDKIRFASAGYGNDANVTMTLKGVNGFEKSFTAAVLAADNGNAIAGKIANEIGGTFEYDGVTYGVATVGQDITFTAPKAMTIANPINAMTVELSHDMDLGMKATGELTTLGDGGNAEEVKVTFTDPTKGYNGDINIVFKNDAASSFAANAAILATDVTAAAIVAKIQAANGNLVVGADTYNTAAAAEVLTLTKTVNGAVADGAHLVGNLGVLSEELEIKFTPTAVLTATPGNTALGADPNEFKRTATITNPVTKDGKLRVVIKLNAPALPEVRFVIDVKNGEKVEEVAAKIREQVLATLATWTGGLSLWKIHPAAAPTDATIVAEDIMTGITAGTPFDFGTFDIKDF